MFKDKPPQYMTSAELEEAIRRHREHTRKLIAEARSRRVAASAIVPVLHAGKPSGGGQAGPDDSDEAR